jgi:hypothetical protein
MVLPRARINCKYGFLSKAVSVSDMVWSRPFAFESDTEDGEIRGDMEDG